MASTAAGRGRYERRVDTDLHVQRPDSAGRPTRCPWTPSTRRETARLQSTRPAPRQPAPHRRSPERPRRRLLVRRRLRRDPRGHFRARQRRNHFRGELDNCRQERRRPQLRRSQRPRDGCGPVVARSDDRNDARGVGAPDSDHVMAHGRHKGAAEQSRLRAVRQLERPIRAASSRSGPEWCRTSSAVPPRCRDRPGRISPRRTTAGAAPVRQRLAGRDPCGHRRDAELEQPLQIGGNRVWNEWLQGQIDDVRVYNRALSATELQSDMNTPVGGTTTTPPPTPRRLRPRPTRSLRRRRRAQTSAVSRRPALRLSWNAATDNVGVAGYDAFLNGTARARPGRYAELHVQRSHLRHAYTLGVEARDAAGNRSGRATVNGATGACTRCSDPASASAARLRVLGLRMCGWMRTVGRVSGRRRLLGM